MVQREYGLLEHHIINTFMEDRVFQYQRKKYKVIMAGKPRPQGSGGECKTDVFVRTIENDTNQIRDFKISVKNTNKEFMGNKLTVAVMESFFGNCWEEIVINATTSLKQEFENRVLVFATGSYPIKPNSITVGWKLEITDRPRTLSTKIPLSDQEIRDLVYKGKALSDSKRNSIVNGNMIIDSGIADYLITTNMDRIESSQDIINQMELIDDTNIGDTYFAFTANNYRTDVRKADGPRSLAVRIRWKCIKNKIIPEFYYNEPLKYTGERDMAPYVRKSLEMLGKQNVSELVPGKDIDDDIFSS